MGNEPGGNGPDRRRPASDRKVFHPRGAIACVSGLAHYRAENYDTAIEHIHQSLDDHRWSARSIMYPALAMACHRNGLVNEAEEAFEASQSAIDAWTEQMVNGPVHVPDRIGSYPFQRDWKGPSVRTPRHRRFTRGSPSATASDPPSEGS